MDTDICKHDTSRFTYDPVRYRNQHPDHCTIQISGNVQVGAVNDSLISSPGTNCTRSWVNSAIIKPSHFQLMMMLVLAIRVNL